MDRDQYKQMVVDVIEHAGVRVVLETIHEWATVQQDIASDDWEWITEARYRDLVRIMVKAIRFADRVDPETVAV